MDHYVVGSSERVIFETTDSKEIIPGIHKKIKGLLKHESYGRITVNGNNKKYILLGAEYADAILCWKCWERQVKIMIFKEDWVKEITDTNIENWKINNIDPECSVCKNKLV